MLFVVLYIWNEQSMIRKGGDGPLYRNLMEHDAYIRRGFDPAQIRAIHVAGGEWMRFQSTPLRVMDSPLPDLPARSYLSPWGKKAQEFTIVIAVEATNETIEFLSGDLSVVPGIFLACIGENWEIYLNGTLVRSEMHLDASGNFTERRTWRDVYFPINKHLLVKGTNIVAFRVI